MTQFHCSKCNHDFESIGKIRASCPNCGTLVRKFSQPIQKEEHSENAHDDEGKQRGPEEENQGTKEEQQASKATEQKRARSRPRQVRVVATKKETPPPSPKTPNAKKKFVKGGTPQVTKRVKTNVEKKAGTEVKRDTAWNMVRRIGWR